MLSQTNFFRAALRHAPRYCRTADTALGASSSRLFSSTAITRDDGTNADAKQRMYDAFDNAEELKTREAESTWNLL
jgi:hypothetical protein